MKLITNVRIVTPEEILDGCQVVIHEDQILRIQPEGSPVEGEIDEQINGYGGWLIPDYWHPDEITAPHTSLNHQASECLALYHAADLLNRKDLRELADRMLLAIEDTGSGWVMPNHNLYYSIKPDGTYVEGDYPYLTYNDLYYLREYLTGVNRTETDTLTYLMGEKLQWMEQNGVTGYEKG